MVQNGNQRNRSVQEQAYPGEEGGYNNFVIQYAQASDQITKWGQNVAQRDMQLRQFYPTEPILASAIFTICARNAAFDWTLEGGRNTVNQVMNLFHTANFGRGWLDFVLKLTTDLFTQDNGAFVEVIHATKSPSSPVIGLATLDAGRCVRTGRDDYPVVYYDRQGKRHRLEPHQALDFTEMPSPQEFHNGIQLCAVSRVLKAAELLRSISTYQNEKVGGRNPQSVHVVAGLNKNMLQDAFMQHASEQDRQAFTTYMKPLIIGTLDPEKKIDHVEIPIASLPDGFDTEVVMRWYINQLALGFGADYQDFAPLPGKSLGSSTQSLVLHMKSRGKGPALFMRTMEYKFNFHGIMPRNVNFRFDEQDVEADIENSELEKNRAERYKLYIEGGVYSPEAVQQELLDAGVMSEEVFKLNREILSTRPSTDVTSEVIQEGEDRPEGQGIKAVDEFSDFMEEERIEAENKLAEDMESALRKSLKLFRPKLLGQKAYRFVGAKQGPEDALTDIEIWQQFRINMIGAMLPNARSGAQAAAAFNRDLGLGFNFDQVNEEILDFTRTYTNDWWSKLEASTRNGLNKAIVAWQESGLGEQGLADLARSIEPMFGKERARLIAQNETTRIFDEGNKLAHEAAGIEFEEWQTARDDKVDSICAPLDGERFPINEGPRPVTGTHIGCRCARLPVSNEGMTLGK